MYRKRIVKSAVFLLIGLLSMPIAVSAEALGDSDIIRENTDSNSLTPESVQEKGNAADNQVSDQTGISDTADQIDDADAPDLSDAVEAPEVSDETGWKTINNRRYYYDVNGHRASGWRWIKGDWYYMDGSDTDFPGVMLSDQIKLINGQYYSFTSSGTMQTGWIKKLEGWYYADEHGALVSGWRHIGGSWYYLDAGNQSYPRLMVSNQMKQIGSSYYYFNVSGDMQTGWIRRPEGWYYADEYGALVSGWRYIGGSWYYLDAGNQSYPRLMVSNQIKQIGSAYYCFNASGDMLTDWIKRPEGWYYANQYGALVSGWNYIDGNWYFLDGGDQSYPRRMVSNQIKQIGNARFCFSSSGNMLTGWIKKPEGWYYADGGGALKTGWLNLGNKWYYLDGGNVDYPSLMLSNVTTTIGGKPYTFLYSGAMKTGWDKKDSGWYYYDRDSGQIVSGWKYIEGFWYYFDPNDNNKMMPGGWHLINNKYYYMDSGGNMAVRWKYISGNYYYLGDDGAMRTGWQFIDGSWYYFYYENDSHGGSYGVMAKNTTIDGYRLQADGRWLTPEQMRMYARAQGYSSGTGWLIMVDRAACRVGIYNGRVGAWNLNRDWSCSPGKPSTPTVSGVFHVGSRGYYFDSGSARCYWYTQFYNNYLFHSVLYSKYNGGLQDGRLGMQLSHGCVRLEINNAKWIYDNIPSGTTVVVY